MRWETPDAASDEVVRLDDKDRAILWLLQQDASTPRARIADLVGLSGPAVLERIRKMEEAGVIRGYAALVDGRKLGLDVTAFVGVSLQHPKHIVQLEQQLAEIPAVLECHHVTGEFTLLLKIKAANTAGIERLISRLRSFDGVQRTFTMVALSTQTERVTLPLDDVPLARTSGVRRGG